MNIEEARQSIANLGKALQTIAELPGKPDTSLQQHNSHLTWLLDQVDRALAGKPIETAHDVGVGIKGRLSESQFPPEIRAIVQLHEKIRKQSRSIAGWRNYNDQLLYQLRKSRSTHKSKYVRKFCAALVMNLQKKRFYR